jgi:1-deoxy-D-xylulose-5-phosphate reductoisomerase
MNFKNLIFSLKLNYFCFFNHILNFQAKKNQISILPIDSEHNAIFQIFEKQNFSMIDNIILTASGGPFFNSTKNLKDITIQEALKHPKWRMGNKISIDSATMMNKGLEVIEAYYFFNLPKDKINIIIHPQSIIHGMVNYSDGSTLSMMSLPDMKVPISYVMNYPDRLKIKHKIMMLDKISRLEFYQVDHKKSTFI